MAVHSTKPKPGTEKLTLKEQRRRFIEAPRKFRASDDKADFDAALKRIAKPKAAACMPSRE